MKSGTTENFYEHNSESQDAWAEWFKETGAERTSKLVTATARLVQREREIYASRVSVATGEGDAVYPLTKAIRAQSPHEFEGESKSVPCSRCGLIYSASVHHAAASSPLPAEPSEPCCICEKPNALSVCMTCWQGMTDRFIKAVQAPPETPRM